MEDSINSLQFKYISSNILRQTNKKEIGDLYDKKMRNTTDLNVQLAKEDMIACNHNGILFPGDSLESYQSLITDEKTRLDVLHRLELNTTRFGLLFLHNPTKDMTILDAGCGGGGSSILIHQTYGCSVEGFTLSQEQASFGNVAAKKYSFNRKVKFGVDDMMNLNKNDNTYDRIWACESTEHSASLDEPFQEFARVAKNKARLVIFAWCANDDAVKKAVDTHYITDIKPVETYLSTAKKYGWQSSYHLDLTKQTTPYWYLRSYPNEYTGAERFMTPGFTTNTLQYFMFCFDLQK